MYRIPGLGVQVQVIFLQRTNFSVQEHSGYVDSSKLNSAEGTLVCIGASLSVLSHF